MSVDKENTAPVLQNITEKVGQLSLSKVEKKEVAIETGTTNRTIVDC
jgi:hypothetical protein